MPKINVYLPESLAEAVKAASIPVSSVCQRALEAALGGSGAVHEALRPRGRGAHHGPGVHDRMTERARQALALAVPQATARGHRTVGTIHLLLGMLDEGGNLGLRVLVHLGVDPVDVRSEVEGLLSAGDSAAATGGAVERPPLDTGSKWVIERSLHEALRMGHNYIGCEHLLLALVASEDGLAGQVLRRMGVELGAARGATATLLDGVISAGLSQPVAPTDELLRQIVERLDRLERRLAG